MQAEIMAIGDELTSGQRLDTNSQWLSQQLGDLGIPVLAHTTVSDTLAELVAALRVAAERADLVVITGGLGPTADDLTRQAMADAAGVELEFRPEVLAEIEARFSYRGRQLPPQNRVQAMFPAGSEAIHNPHGTAPGIDLTWSLGERTVRLIALPGVPAEMKQMWAETVQAAIQTLAGAPQVILHHRVKCFGAGESQLEAMLPDLIHRDRIPRVGITVHQATITLRVTAQGPDTATCRAQIQPTLDVIHECLGNLVFGEEDDELEDVVVRMLRERNQTLSVCEWGTQGIVARWLNRVDRHDNVLASVVVNSDRGLASLLTQRDAHVADLSFAQQAHRVEWMANAVRAQCGTDYGLAIGPLPEPDHPEPVAYFALASDMQTQVARRAYRGHPDVVLDRAAKQGLDLLRLAMLPAATD